MEFKKFVIIDDLLATGGTAKCIIDLLKMKKKEILVLSVIIELTQLEGTKIIRYSSLFRN